MYRSFTSLDELFTYIKEDKEWTGANAAQHNRYPIRYVLFDNFADFNEFIINRPVGIYKHSIETMLDKDYPDTFPSYTELSGEIRAFIKKIPINDFIIYPFSEMARFYDNEVNTEFTSMVKTIASSQAPEDAQAENVRIYIPIVGMEGKMGKFIKDNNTFVWEYKSNCDKGIYSLIITNGSTYGVEGLENQYTVAHNLLEWLKLWEKGSNVKQTIICSSPNIYANAYHAQPDNAFNYCKCSNVYEFLTIGLGLDFGLTESPPDEDMVYWEKLASMIDIRSFNFEEFVKERLDTFTLNDGIDFIKSWFDCESEFDRWLLTLYFHKISKVSGYISRAITSCTELSKSELFSNIATLIFDDTNKEFSISERRKAMCLAKEHGVNITDFARTKLKAKLSVIAASPELGGYYMAVRLLTPLTDEERQLAIEWVGQGKVQPDEIKEVFPLLYSYMQPLGLNSLSGNTSWISDYINFYRLSKLANYPHEKIGEYISEKNGNSSSFQTWRDEFKTVKTILHSRKDIDVIYWIDGLGIDWIPFIRNVVRRYSKEHIYLNEIYIASAVLPTTTATNKANLLSLLEVGTELPKSGDLDTFAHKTKSYPQYLVDEMEIIESSITKLLDDYNGKKIAIVSDHGLTYLSQLSDGMKLAGVKSDHEGRLALMTDKLGSDNGYLVLEDGKTLCSLTHRSLTDKVDRGHGAHGGCTPEEVLVPIIIISSRKNSNKYSVQLVKDEVNGTNPTIQFEIKGLASIDVPTIEYNGTIYNLTNTNDSVYESERLYLVDTATKITLRINGEQFNNYNIKVSTGLSEADDLFDF